MLQHDILDIIKADPNVHNRYDLEAFICRLYNDICHESINYLLSKEVIKEDSEGNLFIVGK